MSISYAVMFSTSETIESIASKVASVANLRVSHNHCGRSPLIPAITMVGKEFELDVTKDDTISQQIVREEYHVEVDTCIRFLTWNSFSTASEGGQMIAKITDFVLKSYTGDLLLLFNEDMILLKRSSTGTIINANAGFWNPLTRNEISSSFDETRLL